MKVEKKMDRYRLKCFVFSKLFFVACFKTSREQIYRLYPKSLKDTLEGSFTAC